MTKEQVLNKFEEGYANWKKFCALMDKYPNDSYAMLQIRMLL